MRKLINKCTHSCRRFAEAVLQVVLFTVLWFKWSVRKSCVAKVLLAIWEVFSVENNQNYHSYSFSYKFAFIFSFFVLFYKPKTRIRFSASWRSGAENYFCFLFIASRALFQSHVEFIRLLKRNFLTCYFCSYYSSMIYCID